MDAERWKRVDNLLQSALRMPADRQGEFLRNACAGDSALEQEVQSLLSSHGKLGDFLEEPVVAAAAQPPPYHDPSETEDTLSGQTIAHYRVLHRLGVGGMGMVYEAEDLRLGRHVALKLLLESQATQSKSLVRFQQEARSIAALNHPHICTVYEVEEYEGRPVIVMELLQGETLKQRLQEGAVPAPQALRWGSEVAEALEAAHAAGLVHRDIKPANVFVTRRGAVKVLDFGLAKLSVAEAADLDHESLTSMGVIPGTTAYMSPEQIRGDELDGRTDLFSLGVMLYEMATGHRPFVEKNAALTMDAVLHKHPASPRELNPDLSPELEAVIGRAMEKDRELRYQSAAELHADLAALAQDMGSGAVSVPRSSGFRRASVRSSPAFAARALRRPAWQFAAALVLIAALGLGIFFAIRQRNARQPSPEHPTIKPRRSIAVIGFRNLSGSPDQEWVSTALSEMLDTELASGNELRVISGENVGRMKLDLSLPATDSYAPETLSKIHKDLGADEVVVGSFLVMGKGGQGSLRIDARVQDVKAGDTIAAVSESGSQADLADLVSRASSELRQKLGIGVLPESERNAIGTSLPSNPAAIRLYSEGIARLRALDAKRARDLLERAAAADPNHALTHAFLATSLANLGYEAQARAEATKAFELSRSLPRRDRLLVEASYHEAQQDYGAAVEAYRTLWEFFPDDIEAGLRLAAAQDLAGRSKDALDTVAQMRRLPEPASLDPRIDLADSRASASLGDFRRTQQSAAKAVEAASRQGSPIIMAEAKQREAWGWDRLGDLDKAMAEFAEVRDLSLRSGNPLMASAAWNGIGAAYYDKGDFENSRRAYEAGLTIARNEGAKQRIAILTSNLGNIFYERGKMEEARQHYQEALDLDRELGSPSIASDLGSLANVKQSIGDLAGAVKMQEESLNGFREAGDRRGEAATLVNLGDVLRDQGHLAEAMTRYEESIKVEEQTGFKRDLGFAWFGMSEILRREDRLAEARAKTEEAIALRKELGDATDTAYSQVQLAQTLIELGNAPEAARLTTDAAAVFAKQKMYDAGCQTQAVLSLALLAQSNVRDARVAAARATDLCRQGSDRSARFQAQFAAAAARAEVGDVGEAVKILEAVHSEATHFGYAAFDLESQLRLGELELRLGKVRAGREHLKQLQAEASGRGFALFSRKAALDLQSH